MSLSAGLGEQADVLAEHGEVDGALCRMSRNQLGRHVVPMIRASTSSWLRMRWASAAGSAPAVNGLQEVAEAPPGEPVLGRDLVPVVGSTA